MSIYYDSVSKQFYEKDAYSVVPDSSREIEPDVHEYYCTQQDYYHINLDAVEDSIITLAGIKTQGINTDWLHTVRLSEANAACSDAIYAGVDVETSEGIKHFSLTEHDQTELLYLDAKIKSGLSEVPYHADGELCRRWSVEEFTRIFTAAQAHIFYHRTYCNFFRAYVKRMEHAVLWEAV